MSNNNELIIVLNRKIDERNEMILQLESQNFILTETNKAMENELSQLRKEIVHLKAYNKALKSKVQDYMNQLLDLELKAE